MSGVFNVQTPGAMKMMGLKFYPPMATANGDIASEKLCGNDLRYIEFPCDETTTITVGGGVYQFWGTNIQWLIDAGSEETGSTDVGEGGEEASGGGGPGESGGEEVGSGDPVACGPDNCNFPHVCDRDGTCSLLTCANTWSCFVSTGERIVECNIGVEVFGMRQDLCLYTNQPCRIDPDCRGELGGGERICVDRKMCGVVSTPPIDPTPSPPRPSPPSGPSHPGPSPGGPSPLPPSPSHPGPSPGGPLPLPPRPFPPGSSPGGPSPPAGGSEPGLPGLPGPGIPGHVPGH